jgi:hypothetical protein
MPYYAPPAEDHNDEVDVVAIAITAVNVAGLVGYFGWSHMRNSRQIGGWPHFEPQYIATKDQPVEIVGGAITSSHSPYQAQGLQGGTTNPLADSSDEDVDASPGPAADTSEGAGMGDGAQQEDGSSTGNSGRWQGVGQRVLVAAERFKALKEEAQVESRRKATVADVFKGVLIKDAHEIRHPYGLLQFVAGIPQSVGLPSLVMSNLGERLGLTVHMEAWAAWCDGGSVFTIMAIVAVAAPAHICGLGKLAVLLVLGLWFGVIIAILAIFVLLTANDAEWIDMHDFVWHRTARINIDNLMALVAMGIMLVQLVALALRVLPDPRLGVQELRASEDAGSASAAMVDSESTSDVVEAASAYDTLSSYGKFIVDLVSNEACFSVFSVVRADARVSQCTQSLRRNIYLG